MAKYASRVKETTATTGTGTINLDGAVAGFRGFLDPSNIADQDYVPYILLDADGLAWEEGYGKVIAGTPNQLERGFVMDSSAAGAAITLSAGTHTVGIGPIAAVRESHIVTLKLTADKAFASGVFTIVAFDAAEIDTDSMWSVGNPTRIIVPQWASTIVLNAGVRWTSNSNGQRYMILNSNDATLIALPGKQIVAKFDSLNELTSPEITNAGGKEFYLTVFQDSGVSLSLVANKTVYLSLRIIS